MTTPARVFRITIPIALLLLSLGILTVYFREPASGPLHDAQDRVGQTLAPVSGVIQRVTAPFRDAVDWVRDARSASNERDRLVAENRRLQQELAKTSFDAQRLTELERLLRYRQSKEFRNLGAFGTVAAGVLTRSVQLTDHKVLLDQGAQAGIAIDDPVVVGVGEPSLGAALAGRVTRVTETTAEVTLISDPTLGVGVTVVGVRDADGILQASPGDASVAILDFVRKTVDVQVGQIVVTSGFSVDRTDPLRSRYPPGIPVGVVTSVSQSDTENFKSIQVTPYVPLSGFRQMLILTAKGAP